METTTIQPTYTASGELDFDPVTLTVRADDGTRFSVWELDDCPKCQTTFHRWTSEDDGREHGFCLNAVGFEPTCDFIVERPTEFPSDLRGADGVGG